MSIDRRILIADDDAEIRLGAADLLFGAVEGLGEMMADEDRYNRFYAGLALRHMDSGEAKEVLLDALFTARWCPVTTNDSRY